MYSYSTEQSRIVDPLIFTVWRSTRSTCAPMPAMDSSSTLTSLTSGRFSSVTVSSVMIAAEIIGSAAFLAPAISTSPTNGDPPFITYCSIFVPPYYYFSPCSERSCFYLNLNKRICKPFRKIKAEFLSQTCFYITKILHHSYAFVKVYLPFFTLYPKVPSFSPSPLYSPWL